MLDYKMTQILEMFIPSKAVIPIPPAPYRPPLLVSEKGSNHFSNFNSQSANSICKILLNRFTIIFKKKAETNLG